MIKKIDHMVITTSDINKCVEFYESLGFKFNNANGRFELFAGDFKINVHLRGRELLPHAKNVKAGSADFCLEVTDDLESLVKKLEKTGTMLDLGIVDRNGVNGQMKSIYLRDPDGNLIELCKYEKI